MLSPVEEERNELGYKVVEVREDRPLRVVHRPCDASDVCLFFVHGGGGRAGQFKHLIKAFESTYVPPCILEFPLTPSPNLELFEACQV